MAETIELTERERQQLKADRRATTTKWTMATVPFVLLVAYVIIWAIPATRDIATGEDERNPIQIATFILLASAGILGLRLAIRTWRLGHPSWMAAFFTVFALGALVVAGDEIAWGQVIGDLLAGSSGASATTGVGELAGFREWTEAFLFGYAVIALAAMLYLPSTRFRHLAPSRGLAPWLGIIGVVSLVDLIGDFSDLGTGFEEFLQSSSELIELMVAVVALLYLYERARDLWFRIP